MNILRNAEGQPRRSLAFLAIAGALALAHSDASPSNHQPQTSEAQKNNYLKQVAIKISHVILCLQAKNPNVQAYPSFRGPAVMVDVPANGETNYELNAVIGKAGSSGDSLDASKTMAVAVFSGGLSDRSLKIVSANPAGDEGLWVSVSRSINQTADPYNQYDPMYVGRLSDSNSYEQQMKLADLAWQETEIVASSSELGANGDGAACLPNES